MRKIFIIFVFCFTLGLTACNTKAKEEALTETKEVVSNPGEISFTLNGYWNILPKEEYSIDLDDYQNMDLSATHTETGTNITILYEDLTKTQSGTLVRIEDYVNVVREELVSSDEYTYQCSEVSSINIHEKNYYTFKAESSKVDSIQHFFIRRIEDTMMIMIITLQEGEILEDIINLCK